MLLLCDIELNGMRRMNTIEEEIESVKKISEIFLRSITGCILMKNNRVEFSDKAFLLEALSFEFPDLTAKKC